MSSGQGAALSNAAATTTASVSDSAIETSVSGGWRGILVATGGGIAAGLAAATLLIAGPGSQPATATLGTVAPTELAEAGLSLDSVAGKEALEQARQCKVPLAYVTLATGPGDPPARVRIRSGAYLSPNIAIANSPRRVAIPYPGPYASGQGVISVEGTAQNLSVWLAPGRFMPALAGTDTISVTWVPKNPC